MRSSKYLAKIFRLSIKAIKRQVEAKLVLRPNALDDEPYREQMKSIIEDAFVSFNLCMSDSRELILLFRTSS